MSKSIVVLAVLAAAGWSTTLFMDCFDDGNADGWTECCDEPDSALYYVENGWYHTQVDVQTSGGVYAQNGDDTTGTPHVMSCCDYTLYCKSKAWSPTSHMGFGVRTPEYPIDGDCYALWLRYSQNDVVIFRHDGPDLEYVELDSEPFPLSYGEEYWIRFEIAGDQLYGKVWQGSLGDEPSADLLEATDGMYTDAGSILVGCQMWGGGDRHAAFDSVMVLTPEAFDSQTWGWIKSAF